MSPAIRTILVATALACGALHAPLALAQESKPAPDAAKPSYPDAKELLKKSVDAVGGADARAAKKSMEMKGTIEMPGQKMKGPIVSKYMQPNKMVTSIDLPGIGEVRSGFDGTVGWSTSKIQGARLMTPKELETIAREADYMKDVDPLRRYDTVETVGEGKFAGVECWKVKAKKGEEVSTLWFEKSTGLPRGVAMSVETQLGKLPVTTAFTEYKEFNGIKLPVRSEVKQAGTTVVTVYEAITFDSVDAAAFELPAEIKALLEPEPADDSDEAAAKPAEPAKPTEAPKPAEPAKP